MGSSLVVAVGNLNIKSNLSCLTCHYQWGTSLPSTLFLTITWSLSQTEADKVHKVRMAVGNGLQQDVWREFQRRFGNIRIYEFYGSTEGNLCLMNHIGKIGTVGRSNFIYKVSTCCAVPRQTACFLRDSGWLSWFSAQQSVVWWWKRFWFTTWHMPRVTVSVPALTGLVHKCTLKSLWLDETWSKQWPCRIEMK